MATPARGGGTPVLPAGAIDPSTGQLIPGGGPTTHQAATPGSTALPGSHIPVTYVPGPPPVPKGSTLPPYWGNAPGTGTNAGRAVVPKFTGSIGQIQPTDVVSVIYGQQRVELEMLWFTGSTSVHGYGLAGIGEGQISAVDHVFVCDAQIGNVSGTAPGSRNFTSYLGAAGDAVPTDLWPPASFDLSGWTAPRKPAYIRFNFYGDSYGNEPWWSFIPALKSGGGTLTMAADVHGRLVYDSRLDSTNGGSGPQRYADPTTWAYSNNPALIYSDLHISFGRTPPASMNWASIAAAATVCEAKGFTCNITFTNQSSLENALTSVLQTCCGLPTSEGGIGLWIDVANAAAPSLSVDEADGSIFGITAQWLDTSTRPTQLIIAFNNATLRPAHPAWARGSPSGGSIAGWKPDTFAVEDPGLAGGTVPLRSTTMQIPGISSQPHTQVVGDYYFNLAAISARLRGTIAFQGVLLTRGMKIHVRTLKGIDADYLVEQADADASGMWPVVLRPYLAALYSSTPLAVGPPVIIDGPDPFEAPPDVTGASEVDPTAITTNTPTQKIVTSYAGLNYGLPDYPWSKQIHVRAIATNVEGDRDAATWDSMAASEVPVPLTGNLPPISDSVFALEMLNVAVASDGFVYNFLGEQVGEIGTRMFSRIIVRLENESGVLSAGVTLDTASSSWGSFPAPIQPGDVDLIARGDLALPQAWWEGPFDFTAVPALGAGATWSQSGDVTVWDASKIADGNIGVLAARIYGAGFGAGVIIADLGAAPDVYINRFRVDFTGPTTLSAFFNLYFSDNGTDWTEAGVIFGYELFSSWYMPVTYFDVAYPVGNVNHRYWKVEIPHDAGQTIDVSEITFYSSTLQAAVSGWVLYRWRSDTDTVEGFMFTVPKEKLPTRDNQWNVSPAVWTEYDPDTGLTYWHTDFQVLAYNERAVNLVAPGATKSKFQGNYYAYVTRAGS